MDGGQKASSRPWRVAGSKMTLSLDLRAGFVYDKADRHRRLFGWGKAMGEEKGKREEKKR